ncbi:hypothetical protein scyTo_0023623, partial [Scyliorhinus torazame]|nr:hypothetical protein [Scyliorhinus torazame]
TERFGFANDSTLKEEVEAGAFVDKNGAISERLKERLMKVTEEEIINVN